MNKYRIILYGVFGIFHLGAYVFTVILNKNTNLLFSMVSWVPWFQWITLIGLLLFITDVVWSLLAVRESEKEKAALTHELNMLKAKLFDLQEAEKTVVPKNPSPR